LSKQKKYLYIIESEKMNFNISKIEKSKNIAQSYNFMLRHNFIISLLFFVFSLTTLNAQKEISNIPKCFCCERIAYQLAPNPPPIIGPSVICPCGGDVISTITCPGATITWTVVTNTGSPVITFTGQGTNSITLNSFIPGASTHLVVKVQIKCGDRIIENKKEIKIKPTPQALFSWSVTYSGTGNDWTIQANGTSGYGNAWRITEVSPVSLDCNVWGYGTKCWEGPALNLNHACTLLPGHQYRIIHWVEKCKDTWQATPGCIAVKWICFTIPSARMATPFKKGAKAVLDNIMESKQMDQLHGEMLRDLPK